MRVKWFVIGMLFDSFLQIVVKVAFFWKKFHKGSCGKEAMRNFFIGWVCGIAFQLIGSIILFEMFPHTKGENGEKSFSHDSCPSEWQRIESAQTWVSAGLWWRSFESSHPKHSNPCRNTGISPLLSFRCPHTRLSCLAIQLVWRSKWSCFDSFDIHPNGPWALDGICGKRQRSGKSKVAWVKKFLKGSLSLGG